jgi:hypothetical protein
MPEIQPSSDRSQSASGRSCHAAKSAATPAPAAIHFHVLAGRGVIDAPHLTLSPLGEGTE